MPAAIWSTASARVPRGRAIRRAVAMPPAIFAFVGQYVEDNYRPQPKVRIKPRSFKHPKDRV